jgi:quercetin dioxygenase-like cupin family protein
MAWADQVMLCQFTAKAGGTIPLHQHVHEQVGCVVSGRVEFTVDGVKYLVGAGDGYAIPSNLVHGAVALEDSVLVEAFSPSRDEYR